MNRTITTLLLIVLTTVAYAQQVLSAGGDQYSTATMSISFTVGEMATSLFAQLDQGFQPASITGAVLTAVEPGYEHFQMYPNPASSYLMVKAGFTATPEVLVLDATGKKVTLPSTYSTDELRLDVSSLTAGVYVLLLTERSQPAKRLRFIKTN